MKIIINTCHGGYGISDEAIQEYCRIIGSPCSKDENGFHWMLDTENVPDTSTSDHNWCSLHDEYVIHKEELRISLVMIGIIESGKINCNTEFSDLKVVEIPDGVVWHIGEFAGSEWVYEEHRTWR